jgi:DNA mismatch repair protein MutS
VQTLEGFGIFEKQEVAAAGALIDYITLTQKGKMPHLSRPQRRFRQTFLEIDATTRRTLEIMHTQRSETKGSLFWAINRTVTPAGARLLAQRLQLPLQDPIQINQRLDSVAYFYANSNTRSEIRSFLKNMPDGQRLLARLSLGRGGPRDLGALLQVLERAKSLKSLLSRLEDTPTLLSKLSENLPDLEELRSSLDAVLDPEKTLPMLARDGDFVRPGYHPPLDAARRLKNGAREAILDLQETYVQGSGINTLKIKHNNILGYFVELSALQKDKLDDRFIHRQTLANTMRYTTVELSELQERILSAAQETLTFEMQIYEDILARLRVYFKQLEITLRALAELDVLTSLAKVAEEGKFTRPIVDSSAAFEVLNARHWVVSLALSEEGSRDFASNNCDLGADQRLWLLTGPNMAGKSTFLRQNALLVILAQMGSFVPAEHCHIGIVDKLFARVGAADDLARGHSTFMVEMVETAAILNQATARSFVILDEVGRGTSTFDGLSIAWSTLEYLHNKIQCRGLFATHYHELTELKSHLPHLFVASMSIQEWQGKIIFLYRVVPGATDKSYGLHVAQLAGLPEAVLIRAQEVLQTLEKKKNVYPSAHIKSTKLKEELPLFATLKADPPTESTVEKDLRSLDVDSLSPRQALDTLYALKSQLN